MYSAAYVANSIANWQREGLSKEEIVVRAAELCMGWPYVWGGYGQYCTSANRRNYAQRSTCPSGESEQIVKTCQILNGSKGSCAGCKFFPDTQVRFFDCRGFTRWILSQVGISLQGAGATSQWNTASNWKAKGEIKDMPENVVCCVFNQNQKDHKTMEHTGLYVGGGRIIHCSGTVKVGKPTDRGWTHFAIPKGLDGTAPEPSPGIDRPTLRKGSSGEYVYLLQTELVKLAYDIGGYGIDGKFGTKTEAAVKQFQRDRGLTPDGVVGKLTWGALLDNTEPVKMYTVTIEHLTKAKADALKSQYADAKVIEEKG